MLSLQVKERLEQRVARIKEGDLEEREAFIGEYLPFIVKSISRVTNRYIESENNDEYMIGLEAFNEAIDKYDSGRGKFISFAALVIRSRVTDFLRKQEKAGTVILQCSTEEVYCSAPSEGHRIEEIIDSIVLKEEIRILGDRLCGFGISFSDLVRESPRHRDTRKKALNIAYYLFSEKALKEELKRKGRLPVKELVKALGVSKKLINRSRIFIIAAVLILDSNLDCLKSYISQTGGGDGDVI